MCVCIKIIAPTHKQMTSKKKPNLYPFQIHSLFECIRACQQNLRVEFSLKLSLQNKSFAIIYFVMLSCCSWNVFVSKVFTYFTFTRHH